MPPKPMTRRVLPASSSRTVSVARTPDLAGLGTDEVGETACKSEQVGDRLIGDLGPISALHVGEHDRAVDEFRDFEQALDAGTGLLDPPERLAGADDGGSDEPVAGGRVGSVLECLGLALAFDQLECGRSGPQVGDLGGGHGRNDHLQPAGRPIECKRGARSRGHGGRGGRCGQKTAAIHGWSPTTRFDSCHSNGIPVWRAMSRKSTTTAGTTGMP